MDKIKTYIKSHTFEFRLVIAIIFAITTFIIWPAQILYRSSNIEQFNPNFQTKLAINTDNSIINNRIYKQDGKVVADFMLNNSYKDMQPAAGVNPDSLVNITTPIYFRYGLTDVECVYKNGNLSSDYDKKKIDYLGDGYVKLGKNELMDVSEKVDKSKYLVIELYKNTTQNEFNDTQIPASVIQFHTNQLLDYLDVGDLRTSIYQLKNDKEEGKKYAKWIYLNELNPTLISTICADYNQKPPYILKITSDLREKNVLDYVEKLYLNDNLSTIKMLEKSNLYCISNPEIDQLYNYLKIKNDNYSLINSLNLNSFLGWNKDQSEMLNQKLTQYYTNDLTKESLPDSDLTTQYKNNIDALTEQQKTYLMLFIIKNGG